jgi:hypothetical protein
MMQKLTLQFAPAEDMEVKTLRQIDESSFGKFVGLHLHKQHAR